MAAHKQWSLNQDNGKAYGWDERISPDERLMIVMVSKLTQTLIEQLRKEIYDPKI